MNETVLKELGHIFLNECKDSVICLAMSKQAYREGFSEIAEVYNNISKEKAQMAGKLGFILEDIYSISTKENLKLRSKEEYDATEDKLKLAKRSKVLGYDEIYKVLCKLYKDETKHGKVFSNLLNKYFK